MKQLKTIIKLTSEINKMPESPAKDCINCLINDVTTEYQKRMYQLLKKIALGENLDFDVLKQKYTKTFRKSLFESSLDSIVEEEELILTKILVDNVYYFVEMVPNGQVYNISSKLIGTWINDKIVIN